MDRKVVERMAGTPAQDAKSDDKATTWLNSNSAGTGAYRHHRSGSATRRSSLCATSTIWRGKLPFERVVIRHISDGAAQLLAVRRGDIDAAFNLIPEQIATLKGEPGRARSIRSPASTSSTWR